MPCTLAKIDPDGAYAEADNNHSSFDDKLDEGVYEDRNSIESLLVDILNVSKEELKVLIKGSTFELENGKLVVRPI